MSIGPSIEAGFLDLRTEAESLLVDLCDLQRKTGHTATDPDNGMESDEWATYLSTPCRVRPGHTQPAVSQTGEQYISSLGSTVAVPLSVTGVQVDDRVMVTRSRDASLVGVALYVKGVPRGSQMVLRRLDVSEVQ